MSFPIIVGKIKERNPTKKTPTLYTYKDVKFDIEGWAKCSDFLPEEFELCFLKTDSGKTLRGWFTGRHWDGLNLKKENKIEYWKKIEEKS